MSQERIQQSGGQLTVDGVESALVVGRIKVGNLLADDERQLDLVMQVYTLWSDNIALAGVQKRGGRLEEEERLLWPGAVKLLDVVPVRFILVSIIIMRSRSSGEEGSSQQMTLTHSCGQCIQSSWGWS